MGYPQICHFGIPIIGIQLAVAVLRWTSLEEIPHIQGQRNPSKMVGGANSCLESNPIPARDAKKAQTNLVRTRTQGLHRDWDKTVSEHLPWRYRSAVDCHRDRGSRCSRLGYGINLLEEVAFNPTTELRGLTQELKKTLGGLKQYLVHPDPGEGSSDPTRDWPRLACECIRSLQRRRELVVACCRVGGTECSSTCMGPSEGGHHYLHYLHHSLAQVNSREGTQLHPSRKNWITDLLSMAPPIRTKPFTSQSVSPIRKLP